MRSNAWEKLIIWILDSKPYALRNFELIISSYMIRLRVCILVMAYPCEHGLIKVAVSCYGTSELYMP